MYFAPSNPEHSSVREENMKSKTNRLTSAAILCTAAYIMSMIGRIPIVLFLKYDPKDIVIALGGLVWGGGVSFAVSSAAALLQMFTTSTTGILGCLMNITSSCAFACTAAFIYKKRPKVSGLISGLSAGVLLMTSVMLIYNYIFAPFYMGCTRDEVLGLLLPAFLPFNLIKGTLNAAFTFILYKPFTAVLRRTGRLCADTDYKTPAVIWAAVCIVIISLILLILSLNKII